MSRIYFYIMCAVISIDICLLIGAAFNKDRKAVKSFMIVVCLILVSQMFYAASLVLSGNKTKIWVHELKFIGIAFFSTAFFKMYMDFFEKQKICSPKNILRLMIVPAITVLLAITNNYHHLFRTRLYILNNPYGSFVGVESGPLFWVYILYSYSIYLIGIIIFIQYFFKIPRIYRMQSGIMIIAAITTLLINFISISGLFFYDFGDMTLISFTIAASIQFYGLILYKPSGMIQMARGMAISEIKSPIIIFDYKNAFLDANIAAQKIFPKVDEGLFSFLESKLGLQLQTDNNSKYHVTLNDAYYVVNLKKIMDKEYFSGTAVLMDDITEMKRRELELEKLANHDYLTGIFNRQAFRLELRKIRNEDLPVAIVHFNIRNMKSINVTYGNERGDEVIKQAASAITKEVSPQGFCARLEGDEFVVILKNTGESDARLIINKINNSLPDIVLINGLALKRGIMDNIQLVVKASIDDLHRNKILSHSKNRARADV